MFQRNISQSKVILPPASARSSRGLLFNAEDEKDTSLQNVGLSLNCRALFIVNCVRTSNPTHLFCVLQKYDFNQIFLKCFTTQNFRTLH
jgi:hypothetical protein